MRASRVRAPVAALLAVVALAGCGGAPSASAPHELGRAFGAEVVPDSRAPAPSGDPLPERGGTVPAGGVAQENALAPGAAAPTPQAALRRYALAYANWTAPELPARERELAALSVGAARLAAEQTAASQSGTTTLAADHVANRGVVVSIAEGQGPARGQWVVVTEEETSGSGPYAGLPAAPHVTFARTQRVGHGWAVSEWSPRD